MKKLHPCNLLASVHAFVMCCVDITMVRGASSGCPACSAEYVYWCPDPLYVLYVAAAAEKATHELQCTTNPTFSSRTMWFRCGSVFCICIPQSINTQ